MLLVVLLLFSFSGERISSKSVVLIFNYLSVFGVVVLTISSSISELFVTILLLLLFVLFYFLFVLLFVIVCKGIFLEANCLISACNYSY